MPAGSSQERWCGFILRLPPHQLTYPIYQEKQFSVETALELRDILLQMSNNLKRIASLVKVLATEIGQTDDPLILSSPIPTLFHGARVRTYLFLLTEVGEATSSSYTSRAASWLEDIGGSHTADSAIQVEQVVVQQEDRCTRALAAAETLKKMWETVYDLLQSSEETYERRAPSTSIWTFLLRSSEPPPPPLSTYAGDVAKTVAALHGDVARLQIFWRPQQECLQAVDRTSLLASRSNTPGSEERAAMRAAWLLVSQASDSLNAQSRETGSAFRATAPRLQGVTIGEFPR